MSQAADLPDCGQLIELQQSIDACLLRDIPALRKQLLRLQRRCREQQAVGRGVERLAARLDRLAAEGVRFTDGYVTCPVCAPSRSSFMTGVYAHTSGNMHFKNWRGNRVLANCMTLSEYLRAHGYHTTGSGKVMHHVHSDLWDEYKYKPDYGPFVYDGKQRVSHPSVPEPCRSIPRPWRR